ncbi:MAG: M56 family metallopeptidase, partial [Verrucomicrobiota bacterium]
LPLAGLLIPSWSVSLPAAAPFVERIMPATSRPVVTEPVIAESALPAAATVPATAVHPAIPRKTMIASAPIVRLEVRILPLLALLWALGAALLMIRLMVSCLRLQRLIARSEPAERSRRILVMNHLSRINKQDNTLEIRLSSEIQSPCAAGLFKPVILLPTDTATWPDERIRMVLLHELAHCRRRDVFRHLLFYIACALHWINPLAWRLSAAYRKESEFDCDNFVVAHGTVPPVDYAETLMDLADAHSLRGSVLTPAMAEAHLSQRIEMMLVQRSNASGRLGHRFGLVSSGLIGCLLLGLASFSTRTSDARVMALPPVFDKPLPQPVAILTEKRADYSADEILNPEAGTIQFKIRVPRIPLHGDYAIFHSDDSRYVVYLDTFTPSSERMKKNPQRRSRIVARIGGNRKVAPGPKWGRSFPSASIVMANSRTRPLPNPPEWYGEPQFPVDVWHDVKITWSGYPEGEVRIYLNGKLTARRTYSPEYDDGRPFAEAIAMGYRPNAWVGELVSAPNGGTTDVRPGSMDIDLSGVDISEIAVYREALDE